MRNLSDSVALITGASSGIGRAISVKLAHLGYKLCLIGRNVEKLKSVKAETEGYGVEVKYFKVDLYSDREIYDLKEKFLEHFDNLDILIHSAGEFSMGYLESASLDDFDRQIQINMRAPFLLTQVMLDLIKNRKGEIIFINSSAGLNARAKFSQYAATKHALKAIADSLRDEVNIAGVRVTSIFPGRTATPMQEKVLEMEARTDKEKIMARLLQPSDVAEVIAHVISLPRTAEVTDVIVRPFQKAI